ncbi:MAG: DUF362 domain-containing protein [bacterium]|nr:DUF362 domain-containing protein [bacterium]
MPFRSKSGNLSAMYLDMVYIAGCTEYEKAEPAVFDLLDRTGVNPEGKRVLVKPNILGPFAPSRHVTTHPLIVAAAVRWLEERGAAEVLVGDNPGLGGYGDNVAGARVSGILEVAGERFVNLAEHTVVRSIPSLPDLRLSISGAVFEADLVVNLPKFKTHTLTTITGAIKNTFGYVVGGAKSRLHAAAPTPKSFARVCNEIYALRPPEINLIDGIIAMEGNGPSGDELRLLGRLLASTNGAALDVAMCGIMGIEPSRVPMVHLAMEMGLTRGEQEILTIGDNSTLSKFQVPSTFTRSTAVNWAVNRLGFGGFTPEPYINEEKCTDCGSCVEACPTEAMRGFPEIDGEACIRCYCCQEMCAYNAVKLRGFWGSYVRTRARARAG